MKFVPKYKPIRQEEYCGLEREIQKLHRSPKLTNMMFYKLDDYIDLPDTYYREKWK